MAGSDERGSLEHHLRRALPRAMKERDQIALSALRTTLAAIANAGAVPAPAAPTDEGPIARARIGLGAGEAARVELSDDEVAAVVHAEIDERLAAADECRRAGRDDHADRLAAEVAVLRSHLDERS
jgi:uncharacterized protein YqeY